MQSIDSAKYGAFTEAVSALELARARVLHLAKEVEGNFKEMSDEKWWSHPFGYSEDIGLGNLIETARTGFTKFIVGEINKHYTNLEIDAGKVEEFVKTQKTFDAAEVIKLIQAAYAAEDKLALEQIRNVCSHLLPQREFGANKHWELASRPEHLVTEGDDTRIELRVYEGYHGMSGRYYGQKAKVVEFLKLVDITLRGTPASKAIGAEVAQGIVYRDDKIKSMRYFKNNNLKVVFHTKEDCDKVRIALLAGDANV
jgi:hypothetical protein